MQEFFLTIFSLQGVPDFWSDLSLIQYINYIYKWTYRINCIRGHRSFQPNLHIVDWDMVWKLGKLQSTYNEPKNTLSSPCTSLHKCEQKDGTKTFPKFPDHISINYDLHEQVFFDMFQVDKFYLPICTSFSLASLLVIKLVFQFFNNENLSRRNEPRKPACVK